MAGVGVSGLWKFCLLAHRILGRSQQRGTERWLTASCRTVSACGRRTAMTTTVVVVVIPLSLCLALIVCFVLVALNLMLASPGWAVSVLSRELLNSSVFEKIGFENWIEEDYVRIMLKSVSYNNLNASESKLVRESYIDAVRWKDLLTLSSANSLLVPLSCNSTPQLEAFVYGAIVSKLNVTNQISYINSNTEKISDSGGISNDSGFSSCNIADNDSMEQGVGLGSGNTFTTSSGGPPNSSYSRQTNLSNIASIINHSNCRLYLQLEFLDGDIIAYSVQYRIIVQQEGRGNSGNESGDNNSSIHDQCISGTLPARLIDPAGQKPPPPAPPIQDLVDGRDSVTYPVVAYMSSRVSTLDDNVTSSNLELTSRFETGTFRTSEKGDIQGEGIPGGEGIATRTPTGLPTTNINIAPDSVIVLQLLIGYSPMKPDRWVRCAYEFVYDTDTSKRTLGLCGLK